MSPRRDARPSSPRPRARWRPAVIWAAFAGAVVSAVTFAFCVIASVAYGWHPAVTKPGIAVSVVVLVGCVLVLSLTGDDE